MDHRTLELADRADDLSHQHCKGLVRSTKGQALLDEFDDDAPSSELIDQALEID